MRSAVAHDLQRSLGSRHEMDDGHDSERETRDAEAVHRISDWSHPGSELSRCGVSEDIASTEDLKAGQGDDDPVQDHDPLRRAGCKGEYKGKETETGDADGQSRNSERRDHEIGAGLSHVVPRRTW